MVRISACSLLSAALLGTTMLAAGGIVAPAYAQQAGAERQYDIPAGTLAEALSRFADQSAVQLSYEAELVADRRSDGLRGRYTQAQALSHLLAGTGLVARDAGSGSLTILRGTTGSITLDQVQVRGTVQPAGAKERAEIEQRRRDGAVDTIIVTAQRDGPVAREAGVGMLGQREFLDTPFNVTSYTDEMITNLQAKTIGEVLESNPSVQRQSGRFFSNDGFYIRGFSVVGWDVGYDGLYGLANTRRNNIAGVERIELLKGPSALLNGVPPGGSS